MNVLVVESHELRADPLRRAGHDVTVATSLREVRHLIEGGSFDAVVLGLFRGEAESLELCDAIRRAGNAVPIVLVVSRDAVEARVNALDAGADDCVPTGCPNEELLARLRAVVRRSARAELR